jgi:hypothetical protein
MKKEDFLQDVIHEIEMLKKHATKREKDNLSYAFLNPSHASACIYGQMTGDCRTPRAHKLMQISCIRTFDLTGGKKDLTIGMHMKTVLKYVNGPFASQGWGEQQLFNKKIHRRDYHYLSALEGYIMLRRKNNEKIIQYIKGEIDTLKL